MCHQYINEPTHIKRSGTTKNLSIRLIYIHVLRYLAVQLKGLCKVWWPLFESSGVASSVSVWIVALLVSFKLRLNVALLTCQDAAVDRWLLPFRFLVQCWFAVVVVDCNKRLSDVVMFVSSLVTGTVRLLLLNEFMERYVEFVPWFTFDTWRGILTDPEMRIEKTG